MIFYFIYKMIYTISKNMLLTTHQSGIYIQFSNLSTDSSYNDFN